ncbi:MAG: PIN domain-containing protein [Candidatus Eremiobacterota bacterium]
MKEHQDVLLLCSPVWHELLLGCARLPDLKRCRRIEEYLERVVTTLPCLAYDQAAAAWHARECARLEARGGPVPLADSLIASIAGARGLVLVTKNLGDFQDFEGIRVVSWGTNDP